MINKLNYFILIFVLIVGCDSGNDTLLRYTDYTADTPWSTQYTCEDYYIKMESYLDRDDYGYYHMEFLHLDYSQTYTTLSIETGSFYFYQKVKFLSNKEIFLYDDWVNVINSNSYTNEYGIARGVMGVWDKFIGDTIKVYSGYEDECGNRYIDSIEVIIDEI